jgi:hypothetical protein
MPVEKNNLLNADQDAETRLENDNSKDVQLVEDQLVEDVYSTDSDEEVYIDEP